MDGKKLKTLKRHLMTAYDMTPEQYRARWGLKADYPTVAPGQAQGRCLTKAHRTVTRSRAAVGLREHLAARGGRESSEAKLNI